MQLNDEGVLCVSQYIPLCGHVPKPRVFKLISLTQSLHSVQFSTDSVLYKKHVTEAASAKLSERQEIFLGVGLLLAFAWNRLRDFFSNIF